MQRGLTLLLLLCLLPPCTFAVRSAKKRKAQAVGQTSRSARVLQDPPLTTLDHRPLRWKTLKARLLPVTHFDPTAGDNVDGDELEVRRAITWMATSSRCGARQSMRWDPTTAPWWWSIPKPGASSPSSTRKPPSTAALLPAPPSSWSPLSPLSMKG